LKRVKTILFFVTVWVVLVYLFGVLFETLEERTATILGGVGALVAAAVKWFSWKKGLTAEERTPKGYFFLYLPWAVSVALPIIFVVVWFVWLKPPEPEATSWEQIKLWAPLFLDVIVPAGALTVAYWMLGRLEKKIV
jgi:hypothetical protein